MPAKREGIYIFCMSLPPYHEAATRRPASRIKMKKNAAWSAAGRMQSHHIPHNPGLPDILYEYAGKHTVLDRVSNETSQHALVDPYVVQCTPDIYYLGGNTTRRVELCVQLEKTNKARNTPTSAIFGVLSQFVVASTKNVFFRPDASGLESKSKS